MAITSDVETITKPKADAYLHKNIGNRPVTQGVVSRYMNDLKKGDWPVTGEPIIFDEDGNLLDGQHRLLAIRNTGISARTLVVRGIERGAFKYMNTGKGRSAGDVLGIEGIDHPTRIASTITFIILFEGKKFGDAAHASSKNKTFITNSIVSDFAKKNLKSIEESIKIGFDKENKVLSKTFLSGFHFVTSRISKEKANDFCERLIMGDNLQRSSPIYKLRKKLLDDNSALRKMSKIHRLGLLCKTWNYYRKNQEVDVLRFDPDKEAIPTLL